MIRQHVVRGISAPVAVGLLLLLGCSGKGDIIPMNLTPKMQADATGAAQVVKPMAGPRVMVIPFEDGRADRTKVGSRSSMWGGETYFNVSSGSAGEETAQAFADYLKRKGWQAQYAKTAPVASEAGPDVVVSGRFSNWRSMPGAGYFLLILKPEPSWSFRRATEKTAAHSYEPTHTQVAMTMCCGSSRRMEKVFCQKCWRRISSGSS
jgi:hypothetical protein